MSRFALLRDTRREVLTALLASVYAQEYLQDCLANQPFTDDVHAKLRADIDKLWNTTDRKLDGRTLDEWIRKQPISSEPNRRGAFALGGALLGALGGAGLTAYVKKNSETATTAVPPPNEVDGDVQAMLAAITKAQDTLSMYNGSKSSDVTCVKDKIMVGILQSMAEAQSNYEELQWVQQGYDFALQRAMPRILEIDMRRLSEHRQVQEQIRAWSEGDVNKTNFAQLEADIRLTDEVTQLRRDIEAKENEVQRLRLEVQEDKDRLTARVQQLTGDLKRTDDELKSLQNSTGETISNLEQILESCNADNLKITSEITKLREDHAQATEKAAQDQLQLEQATATILALRNELQPIKISASGIEQQLNECNQQLSDSLRKQQELEQEFTIAKERLSQYETQLNAKDRECASKIAEIEGVQRAALDALQQGPVELRDALAELKTKQDELDAANAELAKQKSNIAVGSYVTDVARTVAEYRERITELDECESNPKDCGKKFLHFDGNTDTIRKLFSSLSGMADGICHSKYRSGARTRSMAKQGAL